MSPALKEAIAGIKAAFGAPGDHGYETRQGQALFALYSAAINDEWQTIESAPKMKTVLLFAVTDIGEDGKVNNWKIATGVWLEGHGEWEWDGHVLKPYDHKPTHWRPLPSPPRAVAATPATA